MRVADPSDPNILSPNPQRSVSASPVSYHTSLRWLLNTSLKLSSCNRFSSPKAWGLKSFYISEESQLRDKTPPNEKGAGGFAEVRTWHCFASGASHRYKLRQRSNWRVPNGYVLGLPAPRWRTNAAVPAGTTGTTNSSTALPHPRGRPPCDPWWTVLRLANLSRREDDVTLAVDVSLRCYGTYKLVKWTDGHLQTFKQTRIQHGIKTGDEKLPWPTRKV